ncbi:MAG: hypothetical protein PHY41_06530 [Candidatus Cloacimonetes bacterium]|nr:hypothetical protein [Candidatus Cloacimonadota bacterium]MDD4232064.1 hypothetical protein [Candidatus Cloacimonadota bacterium]MDY0299478.1 hypothetical protein [Candidatus Cloacimonadaceae bacterium]
MKSSFQPIIMEMSPRLLSQICRDSGSRFYGSCDRNWWHYKIRDFSSIILQQAGYYLCEAAKLDEYSLVRDKFCEYARASVDFWAQQAVRIGAFEEYYPWERSYPALAFSTLSAAKVIMQLGLDIAEYKQALQRAVNQLIHRKEYEATNQYIAGLAALFTIHKIAPDLVNLPRIEQKLEGVLQRQSQEGWFNEYGGPDLGYLSVSIDCMWDIYDLHPHRWILQSIHKAIIFIDEVLIGRQSIGQHNSRNTDYLAPYGIFRAAGQSEEAMFAPARRIATRIFGNIMSMEHFVHAIDDRYLCHYLGHSFVRAYALICSKQWQTPNYETQTLVKVFAECGYCIVKEAAFSIFISSVKGGNISVIGENGAFFSDYGWQFDKRGYCYVSNWWGASSLESESGDEYQIVGTFVKTREQKSSPLLHIGLRVASAVLGKNIIAYLKALLIFCKPDSKYQFKREIRILKRSLEITDKLYNVKGISSLRRAPEFSRRHVASADSFNFKNLELYRACKVSYEQKEETDCTIGKCYVEF